jgi:hypothetical protein
MSRPVTPINIDDVVIVLPGDVEPPIADPGPGRTLDRDDVMQFNGSSSTDNVAIVNWTWSFVVGAAHLNLYGKSPEYQFEKAGTYNITLTVMDEAGNSDSTDVIIEVKKEQEESPMLGGGFVLLAMLVGMAAVMMRRKGEDKPWVEDH